MGGRIEELALARDPALIAMVWFAGVLKVLGGLLALALVQPWGRRLPRRWLLRAAWGGAGLLVENRTACAIPALTQPDHEPRFVIGKDDAPNRTVLDELVGQL